MEVGSPEWIEASLARLDDLERQRGQHEAALESANDSAVLAQHTGALERLDAEIKTLYAQLESVAGDDEDEDDDAVPGATESPVPTQGDDELSAPHIVAAPAPAPAPAPVAAAMAAPVSRAAESPFGSPTDFGDGGGGFDAPAPIITDDDLKPKGGGSKWVFLAVVVLGAIGVGGYFAMQNMKAKQPVDTGPAEPVQVIKAAGIPDDTEAPPVAPSGHATISPTANQGDPAANNKKKKKDEEKKAKPITLKDDGGPL